MANAQITERDELAHSFIAVAILNVEDRLDPTKLVSRGYEYADAIIAERTKSAENSNLWRVPAYRPDGKEAWVTFRSFPGSPFVQPPASVVEAK